MTHKQEVSLNRLSLKLETLKQVVDAVLQEGGDWHDGTGKDKLVLRVLNEVDVEEATVHFIHNTFVVNVSGWKVKYTIDDNALTAALKEGMKKAKSKKKVKKAEKKAEKKKEAKPKKNDYTNTTYLDVYKRVVGIMNDKTGFAPSDDITDEENEVIDICLDFDGWEHRVWQNARTFLGGWTEEDDGDYEQQSIFELVDDLYSRYEKLADRWLAEFADHCSILGEVNVKDTSPAGIMKALDEAGL